MMTSYNFLFAALHGAASLDAALRWQKVESSLRQDKRLCPAFSVS